MPYQRGPRDHTSRVDFLTVWLALAACFLIPFAVFVLSDGLEAPAVTALILIPATALLFETRRRRAVWERWQSQQKHGSRFEERRRTNRRTTADERPWWQVLGVQREAAPEEVKAAYHAKIKQFHPDTVMGLAKEFRELAERETKEINRAYGQACRKP
jgi:hypothetical protein